MRSVMGKKKNITHHQKGQRFTPRRHNALKSSSSDRLLRIQARISQHIVVDHLKETDQASGSDLFGVNRTWTKAVILYDHFWENFWSLDVEKIDVVENMLTRERVDSHQFCSQQNNQSFKNTSQGR